MEALEAATLLMGICLSGTYIYRSGSPLATSPQSCKALLMGILVAVLTLLIVWSPLGRRTGAHFNPALTLTYFYLGLIHKWDTAFYVLFQFVGSLAGVLSARMLLGTELSMPPVSYVVTIPGSHGPSVAFLAVFCFAGIVMGSILFASNRSGLTLATPFIVACLTISFYWMSATLAGFSVNPARSFSSALFASLWSGLWLYLVAPSAGMLFAAMSYRYWPGRPRVYCAKVLHDCTSPCPFYCHFEELLAAGSSR